MLGVSPAKICGNSKHLLELPLCILLRYLIKLFELSVHEVRQGSKLSPATFNCVDSECDFLSLSFLIFKMEQ